MNYHLPATALMQVKIKSHDHSRAVITVEPLSPGFGLTLGNALRRVLFSSLEGAAITSIRIEGTSHEFSTIKGVQEDVVDLILNLKQVRFKMTVEEPQVIILDVKGINSATAGDFKCPTGVEVVNRSLPIANLVSGGKLLIEATVEAGRGYVTTEQRREEKLPIGVIAIDAAFSPVTLVNFEVENTRVGKMTNYDRLVMELVTDGSIKPTVAINQAAAILVDHFGVLAGEKSDSKPVSAPTGEKAEKVEKVEAPVAPDLVEGSSEAPIKPVVVAKKAVAKNAKAQPNSKATVS